MTEARPQGGTWVRPDGSIDSVQWIDLPAPPPQDLATLERTYFAWVPRIGGGLAGPDPRALGTPRALSIRTFAGPEAIRMTTPEEGPGRRARKITGGLLAFAGGELAFEVGPSPAEPGGTRVTVALTGFRPRMPRFVYWLTQRQLHERSTFAFLREVARTVPRARPAG